MRISFAGILLLLAFVSGDSLNPHYEGKVRRRILFTIGTNKHKQVFYPPRKHMLLAAGKRILSSSIHTILFR